MLREAENQGMRIVIGLDVENLLNTDLFLREMDLLKNHLSSADLWLSVYF